MKKTIITSIALLLIGLSFNAEAQQTYLPVFGNDSTVFYYHLYHGNSKTFYKTVYVKDENKQNTYYSTLSTDLGGPLSDTVIVSSDNSKIWYKPGALDEKVLVMDLNLNVGDEFLIRGRYCQQYPSRYTVKEVFIKDNRKYIVFDKTMEVSICAKCDETDNVYLEYPYTFIEGVGPNIQFRSCFPVLNESSENVPVFISQKKDKEMDYGIDLLRSFWGIDWLRTDAENVKIYSDIKLKPIPVINDLHISVPESIDLDNAVATVRNVFGSPVLEQKINNRCEVINFSSAPSGIYLIDVNSVNYKNTFKVIKK